MILSNGAHERRPHKPKTCDECRSELLDYGDVVICGHLGCDLAANGHVWIGTESGWSRYIDPHMHSQTENWREVG